MLNKLQYLHYYIVLVTMYEILVPIPYNNYIKTEFKVTYCHRSLNEYE